MSRTNFDQLLQAGCHFGHLHRKWNPAMKHISIWNAMVSTSSIFIKPLLR